MPVIAAPASCWRQPSGLSALPTSTAAAYLMSLNLPVLPAKKLFIF